MKSPPTRKPLWLAAGPAIFLFLWSLGFPVAKLGLTDAAPLTFLFLRYSIVLLILLPVAMAVRPPLPKSSAAWAHLIAVGYLIQVVYFGLSYIALKSGVSTGGVAIIVCLQPILIGLIAPHFVGERVSLLRWLGLVLGLGGAAIVILSHASIKAENPGGVVAAAIALCAITAGTLWEKRFGTSHHPVTSNLVQYAVGAICTFPAAWFIEHLQVRPTWPLAGSMLYVVIGNSLVAMTLLLAMIRAGEVSRVSSLFYLVPGLSALFAWPMLGEALPPLGWAGMAVAATGVALASHTRKPS